MSLATFRCPGCGATFTAMAGATITHECPKRRNVQTEYVKEDEK